MPDPQPTTRNLAACFDLPDDGAAPDRIRVAPYGSWIHPRTGPFEISAQSAERMIDNVQKLGIDPVIDYEHQSLIRTKAPAAGWVKALAALDDGLWAKVAWTDEGRRMIEAKEYRYYSPVFDFKKRDPKTGEPMGPVLHSIGLTNTPLLADAIPALVAAKAEVGGQKSEPETPLVVLSQGLPESQHHERSESMDLEELRKILGLDESATEEQVKEAMVVCKAAAEKPAEDPPADPPEPVVACKAVLDALGLDEDADEQTACRAVIELKKPADGVSRAEFVALKADLDERVAVEMVDDAMQMPACKVTPAQRDWALDYARKDPEGFLTYVANAHTIVDGQIEITPAEGDKTACKLTDEELTVCELLDMDVVKFAEAKEAEAA